MNLKARKLWTSIGLLILCLSASAGTSKQNDESLLKPRIVVLTDIAPADVEPDDMESMVRLLAHADMFRDRRTGRYRRMEYLWRYLSRKLDGQFVDGHRRL